jgi:heme-degrading monooxygenase HmoA
MIKRIVKMSFRDEELETFKIIFEESKNKIQNFPGCISVELLQDIQNKNVFFTLSFWDDAADLEAYRHSELFLNTWSRTKILFSEKPAVWSTKVISKPDII